MIQSQARIIMQYIHTWLSAIWCKKYWRNRELCKKYENKPYRGWLPRLPSRLVRPRAKPPNNDTERLPCMPSYCMQPLFTSSFIVGKMKIWYLFVFLNLVTFLIAFRYATEGRHYRKQAKTLTELVFKLSNQGLTSLVLALFGPSYPSVPPFMEWVYGSKHFNIELLEVIFGCRVTNTYDDDTMSPDVGI